MTFFEKNEENLEALVFALTERTKSTVAMGICDNDDTCDKAIAYVTQQFPEKQSFFFNLFGQKINSLLAFFRANFPKNVENDFPIVHITKLDPLLFVSENHKVISSPLVAQINMERELLFRETRALVVFWITKASYNRLRMDAPDFMDWVVAVFDFENNEEAIAKMPSFELPKVTIDDRSKATIHELQEKSKKLEQRTSKYEQNKNPNLKDKKEYFNLLLALIDAYKDLYDLEKTKKTIEKAYTLAKENNLDKGFEFGKLLVDFGNAETSLGNLDKALNLYEEALQHFELLEDKHNIAVSYSKLGETNNSLGNLEKALEFFEEYNKLKKELYEAFPNNVDFKNGLAISYSKLGQTHSSFGNLEQALFFFNEDNKLSKELYEAFPKNVSFKNVLAISYQFLGNVNASLGNLKDALAFFYEYNKLEKELFEEYPNQVSFKKNLAISYSKLGQLYKDLDKVEESLFFFEKQNELSKELFETYPNNIEFKNVLAISYAKLGQIYLIKENKLKVKNYFQQAESLWLELVKDAPQYADFKKFLGMVQEELKDLE